MIKPRHEKTREHLAEHRAAVVAGVQTLAEAIVIEIAEEVADGLWGRMLDGPARRRVLSKLQPRIDDAVDWAERLCDVE